MLTIFGKSGRSSRSENEVGLCHLVDSVEEDRKIRLAVAVHVAADDHVATLLLKTQFALLVVEALLLDELELVVLAALLGVDDGKVDEVLGGEIEDRVAGACLLPRLDQGEERE